MNRKSKVVLFLLLFFLAFSTVACKKEGSAEKAGKKIDNTFNSVKEKIHKATE